MKTSSVYITQRMLVPRPGSKVSWKPSDAAGQNTKLTLEESDSTHIGLSRKQLTLHNSIFSSNVISQSQHASPVCQNEFLFRDRRWKKGPMYDTPNDPLYKSKVHSRDTYSSCHINEASIPLGPSQRQLVFEHIDQEVSSNSEENIFYEDDDHFQRVEHISVLSGSIKNGY